MKVWTGAELARAATMWREGMTMEAMAEALGRGRESVKHQVEQDRERFPRRKAARHRGDTVEMKLTVTKFLHNALRAEAKRRCISMNMVARECIRDALVRRK